MNGWQTHAVRRLALVSFSRLLSVSGFLDCCLPVRSLSCIRRIRPPNAFSTWQVVLKERVLPWLEDFQPDLVFVSAGFDALGNLK